MLPIRALLPAAIVLAAAPLAAQSFDPAMQAKGWAHQDRDFSFTFYDPASASLVTWDKGFGVMNTLSLAKLKDTPTLWLMDRYNNAWVVCADTLYFITKDGKVDRKEKLPAEVGDVAWDAQAGFALLYKTVSPYLEMRDMKDGSLMWSKGQKPKKGESIGRGYFRVCMKPVSGDSQVFYTDGSSLDMTVLSAKSGDPIVRTSFKQAGHASPAMDYAKADPGAVCPSIGKEIIYAAVDSTTLPAGASGGLNGLLLAKMDLTTNALSFQPTGLTPDNRFIGIVDGQATFIKPSGGLATVAVQ